MKSVKDKLLKIIPKDLPYSSDSVIFFEGSNALHSEGAANNFRNFLIDNKIRHNVIANLDQLSDKLLEELVCFTLDSILAFETTGTTKEFQKIRELVIKYSNEGYRFTLLECVLNEPRIGYIPKEANRSLKAYSLYCYDEDINNWELVKLKR